MMANGMYKVENGKVVVDPNANTSFATVSGTVQIPDGPANSGSTPGSGGAPAGGGSGSGSGGSTSGSQTPPAGGSDTDDSDGGGD